MWRVLFRRAVLIGGTVGIIGFLILVASFLMAAPPEPRCRGMSLSEWLAKSDQHTVGEGIAEIGPDAIPFLIRTLRPPHPLWNRLYTPLWKSLPQTVRTRLPWPYASERVRENALSALREFGEEARPALPAVLKSARSDPGWLCRVFAMNAVVAIGHDEPAVASLFAVLLRDPATADAAAMAPYNAATFPSNTLAYFLPALRNRTKPPYNQLLALSVAGPEAREAVPLIVEALKNPQLHGNAVSAIQRIGPDAAPAVPVLIPLLEMPGSRLLVGVCEALMNIGPNAADALPALRKLMAHDDAVVRVLAAAAVAKIGGDAKESIPVVSAALTANRDSQEFWISPVRRFGLEHFSFGRLQTAAWFLGELAPDSRDALPICRKTLENCPEWLVPVLARSIWKIEGDPDEVLPLLQRSLKSKDHFTRVLACITLAEIGPAARPALPGLEAACKISLNTRQAARHAIRRIDAAPSR
ncbi:MAG: HEAT repeat domain-containing protein [Verrucomicrobia bacterium]|nr:HEAT repeat domain-containing protein [Verrucomicrobiota bacterium]